MTYKKAIRAAIEDATLGAIADEARSAGRKARQEARRQEREADATLAAADPLAGLRDRLGEVDAQLERLRPIFRSKGDALAGRLIETLERERATLVAKMASKSAPKTAR